MTDNEIIKAYECCMKPFGLGCAVCPLYRTKEAYCTGSDVDGLVLDLINRQKEEISKKDIEIDILIRKKETLSDEVSNLRAEIEKYAHIKTTINEFWDILLKLKIAKRKEKPTLEELAEAIEEIESEAYKEFAEKVLERKYESSDWSHGEHPFVVEEADIEDVLYELTEERKMRGNEFEN